MIRWVVLGALILGLVAWGTATGMSAPLLLRESGKALNDFDQLMGSEPLVSGVVQ